MGKLTAVRLELHSQSQSGLWGQSWHWGIDVQGQRRSQRSLPAYAGRYYHHAQPWRSRDPSPAHARCAVVMVVHNHQRRSPADPSTETAEAPRPECLRRSRRYPETSRPARRGAIKPRVWPGTSVILAPVVVRPNAGPASRQSNASGNHRAVHHLSLPAEGKSMPGDVALANGLFHASVLGSSLLQVLVKQPGSRSPDVTIKPESRMWFGDPDGLGEVFREVPVNHGRLCVDEPSIEMTLEHTRTRLTSPSGAGACIRDRPCPAASPPPSAITDLINSRRCIVGWGSKSHGHGTSLASVLRLARILHG